jgi:hypothetical protein
MVAVCFTYLYFRLNSRDEASLDAYSKNGLNYLKVIKPTCRQVENRSILWVKVVQSGEPGKPEQSAPAFRL